MDQVRFIIDQIKRTFKGYSWLDPSLMKTLEDVDAKDADKKLHSASHSIWELVLHITEWNKRALETLREGKMPNINDTEVWPNTHTMDSWETTKEELEKTVNLLLNELMEWDNDQILSKIDDSDVTYKELLHGILQHNLYHTGQIALLKKEINSNT